MTKEEIFNMEAGPEIDALFAEKVMKFRRRTITTSLGTFKVYYDDESRREWPIDKWHPSTNISHAMAGVEIVTKKNWFFELGNSHHLADWYAVISYGVDIEYFGYAETPPLAITRALILWAMEKEATNVHE